jgi:hypothetical protein
MPLSASASPTAKTPIATAGFFDLSRELRDIIYDQCEMLEDKPLGTTTALPYPSQILGTKPRLNLRLVCRKLDSEYVKRCEGRKRLLVRTSLYTYSDCPRIWSAQAIKQVNIVHFHVGVWATSMKDEQDRLKDLERWVTRQCSRMSRLRAVSITLYVTFPSPGETSYRPTLSDLEAWLSLVPSLEKLEQFYVVEMCLLKSKKLLVHWERKDRQPPEINYPNAEPTKPCCENMLTEFDM